MSEFDDPSTSIDNEETALSKYEDELERTIQENLTNEQDLHAQKLFLAFQNAATNVTKMFRGKKKPTIDLFILYIFILERSNGTNNWNTFHKAAESVTMLYKGKSSYNRRNRDTLRKKIAFYNIISNRAIIYIIGRLRESFQMRLH